MQLARLFVLIKRLIELTLIKRSGAKIERTANSLNPSTKHMKRYESGLAFKFDEGEEATPTFHACIAINKEIRAKSRPPSPLASAPYTSCASRRPLNPCALPDSFIHSPPQDIAIPAAAYSPTQWLSGQLCQLFGFMLNDIHRTGTIKKYYTNAIRNFIIQSLFSYSNIN